MITASLPKKVCKTDKPSRTPHDLHIQGFSEEKLKERHPKKENPQY